MRYIALLLAYIFLLLAIIGLLLPGLPSVPFLLLAAYCSAKGSPRLHQWLYAQPYLGPLLRDWESQKAISRKSKLVACLMLLSSWGLMYCSVNNPWILLPATVVMIGVAAYLLSRPSPR